MCVRVHDPSVCVCLAVQGAAGAAQKSKIQEWPLGEVSRSRLFAVTLESACEAHIWKGILRFRGVKSSNFFWPAGAAPQGRRGQGASRPARPGSGDFCFNNSNGRVHRKSALSAAHDFGQPLHLFPYRVPFLGARPRRGPGTRVETERSCVARGAHARAQARHTGHAPHRCRQDTPRQHSGRRATRRGHAST